MEESGKLTPEPALQEGQTNVLGTGSLYRYSEPPIIARPVYWFPQSSKHATGQWPTIPEKAIPEDVVVLHDLIGLIDGKVYSCRNQIIGIRDFHLGQSIAFLPANYALEEFTRVLRAWYLSGGGSTGPRKYLFRVSERAATDTVQYVASTVLRRKEEEVEDA